MKQTKCLGDLTPNPKNPRKISDDKLAMLKKALQEFGDLSGIVYNVASQQLIGGHQRVKSLPKDAKIIIEHTYDPATKVGTTAEGYALIDGERFKFRSVAWDEQREKAANIAANKHGGEFDLPMLSEWILELDTSGFDMDLTGFTVEEIAKMKPEVVNEGLTDPDAIPDNVDTRAKLGDIYTLGRHRLMCGDSTSIDAVEKLMDGVKADMVFTDPPYGIAYESNAWDSKKSEVKSKRTDSVIMNDKTTDVGKDALRLIPAVIASEAHIYVWCRYDCFTDFVEVVKEICKVKSVVVWDKGGPGLGDLQCSYGDSEWAIHGLFGRKPLAERQNCVWQVNRMKGLQMVHPTQKPIEICERGIVNSTKSGDSVLDFFGGSGSTLIACEKTNRKCFMMELDPHYCDVILSRWEKFTGQTAKLASSLENAAAQQVSK